MTVMEAFMQGRGLKTQAKRTPLITKLAKHVGRVIPPWSATKSFVLQIGGAGSINYALFELNNIVGFVGVGVSLLLLDLIYGDE